MEIGPMRVLLESIGIGRKAILPGIELIPIPLSLTYR